jgi:V/A-type H+/Na+-transporting ATPase subunit I
MIVPMRKITFIGAEADKERFLERLQEVGIVHILYPKEPVEPQDLARELARVAETRKFLASKTGGEKPAEPLSSEAVCARKDDLSQRESRLQGEIAALKKETAMLEVWGKFDTEELEGLRRKGLHVQFFRVAQKAFETLDLKDVYHRVIDVRKGEPCFVTVSFEEVSLNVPEEKISLKGLSTLQREIEAKKEELKSIEAEYAALSDHLETLKQAEEQLTNLLEYRRALVNSGSELGGHLFTLQCWSPIPEEKLLSEIGTAFPLYHYSEAPLKDERVPVLMVNKRAFDSGEDLVKVYSYPSYQDFDPSGFVLYCFAVFFGMIIGDAGYGLLLLGITFLLNRKVKSRSRFAVRFFRLMYLLSASVILFGLFGGGYFGIQLSPDNPLTKMAFLDFNSKEGQNQVMILSILMGMIHISIALLIRFRNSREYASLGWVIVIWAGYFLVNSKMGKGEDNLPATLGLVLGLILVFVFSSTNRNLLMRALEGLNGVMGIVQIFSDVLSYLRLFALGIATIYMAQAFNMLAENAANGLPGLGYLFAALILIVGHFINLLLGVMGGVIHGLRLNYLEWYRWCFVGDGVRYKAFCLKKIEE